MGSAGMKNSDIAKLAKSASLFRDLTDAEVDRMLFRFNGVKKTFGKNEVLVHAGMEADRLMVVISGHLHVYQRVLDDREVLVREIGVGTVLGLWMLLDPEITSWPATVVAVEPCMTISLDMTSVRRFLKSDDPDVAKLSVNVARVLSRELFSIWRKLSVMSEQNLVDRIHMYLLELSNERGNAEEVVVPFNRERMADFFGVTRPALSRALGQMRDQGLITWRKSVFRIKF